MGGTPASQNQSIALAIVSTPDQAGNIYHIVQPGQALWQIAIAYKVKINDIKSLNGLTSDVIYPNQKLLIMRVGTPTPVSPTAKPTLDLSTFTPLPTLEVITAAATGTATPVPVAPVQNSEWSHGRWRDHFGCPAGGGVYCLGASSTSRLILNKEQK